MAGVRVRVSHRTTGAPAIFYWRYCVDGKHVEAAVYCLMEAVDAKTGGRLAPYKREMIRARFKSRITTAKKGGLQPDEECGPIAIDPDVFEIRWTDVKLPVPDPVSGLYKEVKTHYRLYYGEPTGACFVGLHAHEKEILGLTDDEIKERQNGHIRRAVRIFRQDDCWGVTELTV